MSDFTIILSILRRRQNPVTRLFNPYINTRPPCGYLLPRRGFTHQHPARSDNLSRKSGQRQRDSLAQCLKHGQREEKRRLLGARSEEHTSELQSLMRISYAVFCLKKKKNRTKHILYDTILRAEQYSDNETHSMTYHT